MATNNAAPAQCYQFTAVCELPCESVCPQCNVKMRRIFDAAPDWNVIFDICKCGYRVDIPVEELVSE